MHWVLFGAIYKAINGLTRVLGNSWPAVLLVFSWVLKSRGGVFYEDSGVVVNS